ncbi:MAG TPA: hypothetical protein DEG17_18640 [Cyanobacteria bacterium UBA11149]|nr:hypothetical protein [Cyanobacteria bacterium UBA11149]
MLLDEFKVIIDRIASGKSTEADIAALRRLLSLNDRELSTQLGKYNVNIGEGKEIHIGDRIYQQWDEEAMKALVKAIQETSGIHQIIQSGDAAARDIDKSTTIFQFFFSGDSFKTTSQESFRDLDLSGIPEECIQQAYQDSLPPDAGVWGLAGNNLDAILKELEEFRQIPQFLERLSQDQSLPVEIRDRISKMLASKKYPDTDWKKSTTDFFNDRLEPPKSKSYLIATLVPDDGEKFWLNAWLIIDDAVKDLSKFQSLLDPNEQQTGTSCKLTQVSTELNKFLKKALRYLRGKWYSLTIEFFLPSDLMCMEIDRWKISDPVEDEITLGIKYPIRLRSLERLNLDYLDSYLSQWYEYWDKVRNILQNEPTQELFEPLEAIESFDWKILRSKLQERIGLKVTCPHPQSIRKDLFRAILQATTPIAIWIRNDIPNLDRVTAIDEILNFKPLCHLCESVRQTREKADAQPEEHLGLHLALLWENPYRLTPDIMLELIAPGQ